MGRDFGATGRSASGKAGSRDMKGTTHAAQGDRGDAGTAARVPEADAATFGFREATAKNADGRQMWIPIQH